MNAILVPLHAHVVAGMIRLHVILMSGTAKSMYSIYNRKCPHEQKAKGPLINSVTNSVTCRIFGNVQHSLSTGHINNQKRQVLAESKLNHRRHTCEVIAGLDERTFPANQEQRKVVVSLHMSKKFEVML